MSAAQEIAAEEDFEVLNELKHIAFPIVGKRGKQALKILSSQKDFDIANPKEWDLLIDDLLNHGVEMCPNCTTWCISYMLTNMNGHVDGKCDNCRK